ncbi:MAG: cytochrome c biosis ATP-binding export protein CcmA [Pseudomonadota bacterium]|jgi:heme exporter protein A
MPGDPPTVATRDIAPRAAGPCVPRRGFPDSGRAGNSRDGGPALAWAGPPLLRLARMSPSTDRLSAASLACARGGRLVFRGLGFELGAGEALALRGPNGSGKSSLLRLLAGLLPPAEGAVRWNGEDVAGAREAHRARIGWLGMQDALKPALALAENLRFAASLRGAGPDAARRGLEAMGLGALADVPARRLSQGQRRRAAIARVIAQDARLWLLDEPTLALDDEATGRLGEALAAHLARGGLAVVATHVDLPVRLAGAIDFAAAP